jgi:hypothetical protein
MDDTQNGQHGPGAALRLIHALEKIIVHVTKDTS